MAVKMVMLFSLCLWVVVQHSLAQIEDNVIFLKTPDDGERNYTWAWMTTDNDYFVFEVKSCQSAGIALSRLPYQRDQNNYEVNIGHNVNEDVVIREQIGGGNSIKEAFEDLLNCDEYRPFWVSWKSGTLAVGRGLVAGEQELLSYFYGAELKASAVSLATNYVTGQWMMPRDQVRTTYMSTKKNFNRVFRITQRDRNYMVFAVRSAGDARIHLTQELEGTDDTGYIFIIGAADNLETRIRYGSSGVDKVKVSTPNILSETEYRYFWVRWDVTAVEVGYGMSVGERRIASWTDENYEYPKVLIGFSGQTIASEFMFHNHAENSFLLTTGVGQYILDSPWVNLEASTFFVFTLRSCSDAVLQFHHDADQTSTATEFDVKVILGVQGNTKSQIIFRDYDDGDNTVIEIDSAGILSCDDYRSYYMKWDGSTWQLHRGVTDAELGLIFSEKDPRADPRSIRSVYLGTESSTSSIEWEVSRNAGRSIKFQSSNDVVDQWLTVSNQYDITFRVKGCQEAEIYMADYLKTLDHDYYRLVIGASNNHKIILYREDDVLKEADLGTDAVLDCTNPVTFWLSWRGGLIQLGLGGQVNEYTQLSYNDPPLEAFPVTALGLAAGDMLRPITWDFSQTAGQAYVVFTKADGGYTYSMTTIQHVFPFAVKAGSDALIKLSRYPGDKEGTYIEVTIGKDSDFCEIRELASDGSVLTENIEEVRGVLDSSSFREFWIDWRDGGSVVSVGSGLPYDDVFVQITPTQPFTYMTVSLASGPQSGAEWAFSPGQVVSSLTTTLDVFSYEQFWISNPQDTSFIFRIKACRDAHVFLTPQFSTTVVHAYEIVVGASGNTRTVIRNVTQDQDMAAADTTDILSCDEYRPFWVSWANDLLEVGRGYGIGVNRIIHWQDPTPRAIHAVTISTYSEVSGDWELPKIQDELFFSRSLSEVQVLPTMQTMSFYVDSCGTASLTFCGRLNGDWIYKIDIGSPDMSSLQIIDALQDSEPVVTKFYPNLLQCGVFRTFWVRWDTKLVEIGLGKDTGQGLLAGWFESANEEVITVLSFGSGAMGTSYSLWALPQSTVSEFDIQAYPEEINWNWFTTVDTATVLSVKACSDVYITASENLGITTGGTYQFIVKYDGLNTIRILYNGSEVATADVASNVISCDAPSILWVQWMGGSNRNMVAIGNGSYPGQNILHSWSDPNTPLEVRAVAFGTSNNEQGVWQLHSLQGESYRIKTTLQDPEEAVYDIDPYQNLWVVPPPHVTTMTFKVAACSSVTIALSQEPGNTLNNTYEVFIGADGNSRTGVRSSVGGEITDSLNTPNILSCTESRQFWVSWTNFIVRIGRNSERTNQLIQTIPLPAHRVYALAFAVTPDANDPGSNAAWEFDQEKVGALSIRTTSIQTYDNFWMSIRGRHHLVFSVKVCSQALIALVHTAGLTGLAPEFEIILTNNEESYLMEYGVKKQTAALGTILDCDEYRTFWIYWRDNHIRVGSGPDIGLDEVMSYNSSVTTTLNAVSMSSNTVDIGQWDLTTLGENIFKVYTTTAYDYSRARLLMDRDHMSFRVRACSDVHIILSSSVSQTDIETYEIVIGGWDNTRSVIRRSIQGEPRASADTYNILDCDSFHKFWISWRDATIEVGSGDIWTNTILYFWDEFPYQVNFAGISTASGFDGDWEIDQHIGETLYAFTGGDHDFEHTWVSVTGRDFLTFKVAACQDAHIALAAIPGVTEIQTYEIIIGSYTNTRTEIKNRAIVGYPAIKSAETNGILGCYEMRRFWISWTGGKISVGSGNKVNDGLLVDWTDPDFHPVRAVGLTSYRVPAEWRVSVIDAVTEPTDEPPTQQPPDPNPTDIPNWPPTIDQEKYLVRTPVDLNSEYFWLTTDSSSFLFEAKACKDITIFLAKEPRAVRANYYIVVLDGSDGDHSTIKREDVVVVENDNIGNADCDNFKPFWLSWSNGHIQIGKGRTLGQDIIIQYTDDDPILITSLGLSTNWGTTGEWTFTKDAVNTVYAISHAQLDEVSDIWIGAKQQRYLVFGVHVCNDANFLLAQEMENPENTTVLVLGGWGNTKCAVKTGIGSAWEYQVQVPDLMSCSETRYFWISWVDGVIEAGTGTSVGSSSFLQWKMSTNHEITMAGIYSWDRGGVWEFYNFGVGDAIGFARPFSQANQNHWLNVDNKYVFEFGVRGCSDAVIEMHDKVGPLNLPTLTITIGQYDNKQTTIEFLNTNDVQTSRQSWNTPDMLSCLAINRFWISWMDGKITLGRYDAFTNELLSVDDPYGPRHFRSLHMGNGGSENGVEWSFNRYAGNNLFFQTTPSKLYEAWLMIVGQKSLVFRLKACQDARIYLSEFVTIHTVHKYMILLGYEANTKSSIENLDNGAKEEGSTPFILACQTTQYFWVSWTRQTITIGHGISVGERAFLSLRDITLLHNLNAASFATGGMAQGEWEFSDVQGGKHLVITENAAGFNTYWLAPTSQLLQFSVQSCQDAKLALATFPGVYSNNSYEVTIGGGDNSKTHIISSDGLSVDADTPNILDCNSMRDFWVSWSLADIRVGKGLAFDNSVINMTIPKEFSVNAVALRAGADVTAEWLIDKSLALLSRVYTTEEYQYLRFWMTTEEVTSLSFKVQTCNDAHILMAASTSITNANVYEVCLGGGENTKTWIRNSRQGENQVEALTDGIVSCNETRPFWISWANGNIQVGQGVLSGINKILEWQDPEPKAVHALSVSTGWGATGEWEFSSIEDGTLLFNSLSGDSDYIVPVHHHIQFGAQACAGITVSLKSDVFDFTTGYDVVFGSPNNSAIQIILNDETPEVIYEMLYPDITNCYELRTYWVRWAENILSLGLGDSTSPYILEYVMNQPIRVNGVSFYTTQDAGPRGGLFTLLKDYGKRLAFTTSGTGSYTDEMMLTHAGINWVIVQVNTCGTVLVALMEVPGLPNWNSYEIRLAVNSYQDQHAIYKDGVLQTNVVSDQLGSCDMPVNIWVMWGNGYIEAGKGVSPGSNSLIKWQEIIQYPVNAVGFNTIVHPGTWEIGSLKGNIHSVYTPQATGSNVYVSAWFTPARSNHHLSFMVRTCKDAMIALMSVPAEIDKPFYEIIIGLEDNSKTVIRNGQDGAVLSEADTPAVLDCTIGRLFWVSWFGGHIQVGQGDVYTTTLTDIEIENAHDVNSVSISTGNNGDGYWEVPEDEIEGSAVDTIDQAYPYWMTVAGKTSYIFSVRVCSDVQVALASLPGNVDSQAYIFNIQVGGRSFIKIGNNGAEVASNSTSNILGCNTFNAFWVSWENNVIQAGTGPDVGIGSTVFLFWQPSDPEDPVFTVNAIGISTSNNQEGVWMIGRHGYNPVTLLTWEDKDYHKYFVQPARMYVEFEVRACSDVHLALEEFEDVASFNTYEILIGGWANTKSVIRKYVQGANEVEVMTENIVSCSTFKSFWVSWDNDVLDVGTGKKGEHSFMSIPLGDDRFNINYVAFTTGWGHVGEWDLKPVTDEIVRINTPDSLKFDNAWVGVGGKTYLSFQVQACNDAHLALCQIPANPYVNCYEVLLGGWDNQISAIRRGTVNNSPTEVREDTPDLLSCSRYTPFWVSWEGGVIEAGYGLSPGQMSLISWTDPDFFTVNSIGFMTAHGSTGSYTFKINDQIIPPDPIPTTPSTTTSFPDYIEDEKYVVYTPGEGQMDRAIFSTSRDYFTFTFKSCQEVQVTLSTVPGDTTQQLYRITIGAESNTKTYIERIESGSSDVDETDTPDVLPCDSSSDFWIDWRDNSIKFGKGRDLEQNILAQRNDLNMFPITAVAMDSTNDNVVRWEFEKGSARTIQIRTSADLTYEQAWFHVKHQEYVIFHVKVARDALILLTDMIENTDQELIVAEITIGDVGNTISAIRQKIGGSNEVEVDTPGILNGQTYKTFWIRWHHYIEVGQGPVVGTAEFMRMDLGIVSRLVNAVALSTAKGIVGDWRINSLQGERYTVLTPDDGQYQHAWLYKNHHYFDFHVKACQDATLLLTSTPLETDENIASYEVIIGASGNTKSQIKRYPNAEIMADILTPNAVDCHSLRRFWVSWFDGHLRVGLGLLFEGEFMDYRDQEPITIRAVSLKAEKNAGDVEWDFAREITKSAVMITPADYVTRHLRWISSASLPFFRFKLKADSEAHVVLAEFLGVTTSNAHEVVLGTSNNKKCTILDGVNGNEKASYTSPDDEDILNVKESRWFWMTFTTEAISVGRGLTLFSDVIMTYDASSEGNSINPVSSIAISTESTSNGFWEFSLFEDLTIDITTDYNAEYRVNPWIVPAHAEFTFQLRACQDAKLILTDVPRNDSTLFYEITLGAENNQKVIFTSSEGAKQEQLAPNHLDCNNFQDMWLSFYSTTDGGRRIRVGLGEFVNENQLAEYTDSTNPHRVHSIGFKSSHTNGAQWVYPEYLGRANIFNTVHGYHYDHMIYRVATRLFTIFQIKACSDGHVALFDSYNTDEAYEIVIGASSNQWTIIRNRRLQYPVAQENTPDILSCTEYRSFWITWYNFRITVGYGLTPGVGEITSWQDSNPTGITYLSISTWDTVDGDWIFSDIRDNTNMFETYGGDAGDNMLTLASNNNQFFFAVRACADAIVDFHTSLTTETSGYSVVIGTGENTKSVLKDLRTGNELESANTPDILSCTVPKMFLIRWENGLLVLYAENELGREILSWAYAGPIMKASMRTSNEHRGHWDYGRFAATTVSFDVNEDEVYGKFWQTVPSRQEFVFSVQACSHVLVLLSQIPRIYTVNTYEIAIGEGGKVVLRREVGGATVTSADSPGILECDQLRRFWVRWESGLIEFGTGLVPGMGRMLQYMDPNPYSVYAVGLGTGKDHKGSFELTQQIGNKMFVFTPDSGNWLSFTNIWIAPEDNYFTFAVAACKDAHIGLSSDPYNVTGNTYWITIGGWENTRSTIREFPQDNIIVTEDTIDILSCTEYRRFWISWNHDSRDIQVGQNDVGQAVFMAARVAEPMHYIHTISLETGWGATGRWEFDHAKIIRVQTPEGKNYQQTWVTTRGLSQYVLQVRGCEDARIVLSSELGLLYHDATEIRIQSEGTTSILSPVGGKEYQTTPSSNLLSCSEMRTFWLSWEDNNIEIGQGSQYGENSIVSYQNSSWHQITALGITAGRSELQWQFLDTGEYFNFQTAALKSYSQHCMRPSTNYIIFQVKACKDVHVALSSNFGYLPDEFFEVIFGCYGNTFTDIRHTKDGNVSHHVHNPTPYLMNCNEFRQFWVSWTNDTLAGGIGELYANELVYYKHDEPLPTPMNVAFSTWSGTEGGWKVKQIDGEYFGTWTNLESKYSDFGMTLFDQNEVVIQVQSCSNISMVLAEIPGQSYILAYQIVLTNGTSMIRDGVNGEVLTSANTPDILSCQEFRMFWMSWTGGRLGVGKGGNVGQEELMSLSQMDVEVITSLHVGSITDLNDEFVLWDFVRGNNFFPTVSPGTTTSSTTSSATTSSGTGSTTSSTTTTTQSAGGVSTTTTSTSTSTTTPGEGAPNPGGGLSTGGKVGIAFGVIGAVLIALLLFLVWYTRRDKDEPLLPRDQITSNPLSYGNPVYDASQPESATEMFSMRDQQNLNVSNFEPEADA